VRRRTAHSIAVDPVDAHDIEAPAGRLAVDVVAHGGALPKVIEAIDASDGEHEEIAKIGGLRAEEVGSRRLLVVSLRAGPAPHEELTR
jgi:hypothetical protein